MTVYVDDFGIQATVRNGSRVHRSRWYHLVADTQDELHEFAVGKLGLRRSYFQLGPRIGGEYTEWHYDLTEGKRRQAIRAGAVPVSAYKLAEIMAEREDQKAR